MGKKTLFVICLLLFVLIAGCNSTKTTDEPSANSQEKVSEKRQKETNEEQTNDSYKDDETGELFNYLKSQEKIESQKMGPLNINFEHVNIMKLSNIPDDRLSDYQSLTDIELSNPFHFIDIKFSVENTDKETMNFSGISHLILDNKEQIKVSSNNLYTDIEQYDMKLFGNAKRDYQIAVPIESDVSKIKSVRIVMSAPFDENLNSVSKPKELTVNLK
ncbi:hypothetical protein BA81_12525 [Bacillus safensis FO-36b]|uniref:hypothetical protein n=1 Tax=Bacillus TaxID=1386 RepID=UPI00045D23FC|nr:MULTISPECIES: hypothetical protein [Bacillus]AWI37922.1 hypothetical protein RS87_14440 [Bacillus safensis FO-36b]KDE26842.1 hypothetical protein BA81_12525 [Bacillus safensis FO-36b]MCY1092183.1 hypothetical protein [Bacillus safensis]MCY7467815.1 hypothetical protein [Bacillus safensis]MEC1046709.1 hypothetical protein [Bacillus safensis]